ncbi:MAG: DNA topoisomerase IB [Rubrobacteraceae bacterium]
MGEHVLFKTGIRRLGSKERGFFYRYPGTDETVREESVLARIENLKVPPAWEDARIARSPSAKVQAIGYDSAGRLQYLYHPKYRERKEHEKFERILRFSEALPRMRHTTSAHLRRKKLDREKVLATMTRLMNAAYFRVGDERYARKNRTYGIATLRRKHLRVEGDTMVFEYTGKWGQVQRKVVTDARLRRIVQECAALPGYEIFKYLDESGEVRGAKARDLNAYVKEVMGEEFTPKDFRTWAGTLFAAVKLAELGATEDLEQAEKNVLEAVDDVAQRLGNTRDIARASYISPRVIDHYMEGSVIAYYGELIEEIVAQQEGLTEGEEALLELLNKNLRRELRKAA